MTPRRRDRDDAAAGTTAENAYHLGRLRATIRSFIDGDLDIDDMHAALESTTTVLERDSSGTTSAVGSAEAEIDSIRFTRSAGDQRAAALAAVRQLVATLPPPTGELADYQQLAFRLLDGSLTPREFETAFLDLRRADGRPCSDRAGEALDQLFYVVDAYVDDRDLREPARGDLDADQLRAGARRFVDEAAILR